MRAALALLVVAVPAIAVADPIAVTVVDTAGDVAFVSPGRDAGVVAGVTIQIGARTLTVVEATAATAAVRLDGAPLAVGATGVADVTPGAASAAVARLAAPRPLDGWRQQWPTPTRPADAQHPAEVPLGAGGTVGRLHAALTLHGAAALASSPSAGADLRAQVSYQLVRDRPLAVDLDVSGRGYLDGTSGARTPVWVHKAQLRYGDAYDPRLALGRLAWAATGVGLLDGVRAMAVVGGVELAGFGGVVPDPIDGRPDAGAARFGAEAIYDDATGPWQPRLSLTLVGSTWRGALDERRVTATAEASRGALTASGWAEAQAFASDNPWGASAVEVTGAGAALDWHRRGQRASIELGLARPERSLRLAAALPRDWLCWRSEGAVGADPATEACAGDDRTLDASAAVGLTRGPWAVDATVRASRTMTAATVDELAALARLEYRLRPHLRLVAGGAGGRAGFLDWYAVEAGVALDRGRRWDAGLRYRPELIAYAGALDRFVSHTLALDGRLRVGPTLDAALALAATTGEDRDALAVLTTLAWRPAP
ncbi:MAG: hypothetical protein IPL61_14415 [Myxococcales bacterium]|nr:hypothetical protein [Myxococcales bacterium]